MWLVFLILILVKHTICNYNFNYCQVGSSEKCLGDTMKMYDVGIPNYDAGYLSTFHGNYESCQFHCIWNAECYMASFNTMNNTCDLYKNITYTHTTSPDIKLFLWYCCNINSSFDASNRCPGFWKYLPDAQSDNKVRSSDPIKEILYMNLIDCQYECLSNPICGAVNYFQKDSNIRNNGICQLIIQFPVENLQYLPMNNWSTYQWQCANNYTLPEPPKECKQRKKHANGYWVLQNKSIPYNFTKKHLIYFNTLDLNQCLANCALYAHCKIAWYSRNSFLCILEATEMSDCKDLTPKNAYNFTTYIWQNCYEHQSIPNYKRGSCSRLFNNKYVYINPIECGNYSVDPSNIYKCWKNPPPNRGKIFSYNLHCQINQSFQVYESFKPSFSISKEFSNVKWLRVYTGYDSFWLVNVSDANIMVTTDDECDIFDANMYATNYNSLKILKHSDWYPSKPTKKENPFPNHPVKHVIISDTQVPFCNCFTIEACSSILRRIQNALQPWTYSIPYNFVITGDGIAYEARGWNLEPAIAGPEYNSNSFAIALCGEYYKIPGFSSISSVKKLIQMSINLKKVSENYTLYIYNDLRDKSYPYDGLRRVFKLWPHYRGHIKDSCYTMSISTISFNIIAIFTCILLLLMFILMLYFKILHHKHCLSLRNFRIESMYGNLFKKTKEILPQILFQPLNKLQYEGNFISPITSSVLWVEDWSTIDEENINCKCQNSIFSILDINHLQSNLVNIRSFIFLEDIRCCTRIIIFIFQRHAEMGNECLIILHLRREKSFFRFLYNLYQNKCICDTFNLTEYVPKSQNRIIINKFNEENKLKLITNENSRESMEKIYSFRMESKKYKKYYD